MTQNFFAICRQDEQLAVKRLRLDVPTNRQMVELFDGHASDFMRGVSEETSFDGGWKPDDGELLTIANHPEVVAVLAAVAQNIRSIADINVSQFADENITAIFTKVDDERVMRLLIQAFTSRQLLSHKFVLKFDQNHFNRLEDESFALGDKLTCIVDGSTLKFKSYHNTRHIFDLTQIYSEATDADIDLFVGDGSPISVTDLDAFKFGVADQGTRKLIHSVLTKRNITQYTPENIRQKAEESGLTLDLDANGKIILPLDRKAAKILLSFLDDKLYEAPLSGRRCISNSSKYLD